MVEGAGSVREELDRPVRITVLYWDLEKNSRLKGYSPLPVYGGSPNDLVKA